MQDALDVDPGGCAMAPDMGGVQRGRRNQGSECLLVTSETVRPALYRTAQARYTVAAQEGGMRRLAAAMLLGMVLLAAVAPPAHAGAAVDAALALGAFAVFSQLFVAPFVYASAPPVVYSAPPVYAAAPPAYAPAPAAPAVRREVVYPHGRHVLLGDGVRVAYEWVWVPNPPAGPPPPPPRR